LAFEIIYLAKVTLKVQLDGLYCSMKDKKKMKVTEHSDGSTTYTPTSGVGFYNPFCLLKKDFKFDTENLPEGLKYSFTLLEIVKSIDQTNRITTSTIQSIGSNFGLKRTAITNLINGFSKTNILIKISQGWYKVNESLVIFKQDHAGYLALQQETKSLTQNVTNNYNIVVQEGQSLRDILLARHEHNVRMLNDI
jgi:hypothetical protein